MKGFTVLLQTANSATYFYYGNVSLTFLLLLTAFDLGVLHDGFCILTVYELGKWQVLRTVNEKQKLFRYYQVKFFY